MCIRHFTRPALRMTIINHAHGSVPRGVDCRVISDDGGARLQSVIGESVWMTYECYTVTGKMVAECWRTITIIMTTRRL